MMETMILVLLLASIATQQVLSQSGVSDKSDNETPAWNNRHQHFTMHFGKRLEPQELPASILAAQPRAYDLFSAEQTQHLHQPPTTIKFPYWLSIQLERGQTLHAVPPSPADEQESNGIWSPLPNGMPVYSLERPFAALEQQQQQVARQQQQQLSGGQKLLKLISGGSDDEQQDSAANGERAQPSSNYQEDGKQINVNTRSMQNQIKVPKHFIPVLYGAGSNYGTLSYNKKAEPKDNYFMHFGKK